jgi:hypothetical protein
MKSYENNESFCEMTREAQMPGNILIPRGKRSLQVEGMKWTNESG